MMRADVGRLLLAGALLAPIGVLAQAFEPSPPAAGAGPPTEIWAPIFAPPRPATASRRWELAAALRRNDEAAVRRLLAEGADANAVWGRAEPSLAIAIRQRSLPLVRLLLEYGADADGVVPAAGATLLQLAVRQADRALVAALVEAGAGVNRPSPDEVRWQPERSGDTALHEAAALGDLALVEYLLGRGGDVNAPNRTGLTPLHHAAGAGQLAVIGALLGRGAEIDRPSRIGATPLHWAVRQGQIEAVRLLVEQGAEVNVRTAQGSTPLHGAVARGARAMVEILLAQGASVDAVGLQGETPLMLARRLADPELIRRLEAASSAPPP